MSPLILIVFAMLGVAFFSTFERKVMAYMQGRVGPDKVSFVGLLQPFADALKLLSKEEKWMDNTSVVMFYMPSMYMMVVGVFMWVLYPSVGGYLSWSKSGFFLILLFSISVYGVMMMGWYSNSKYAALGCVRSTVQTISYEIGVATSVIFLSLVYASPSMEKWVWIQQALMGGVWMPLVFFTVFFIFLVETNRSPFDLSEGESELVSGFCVEYGGVGYTLIFLSENLSLLWVGVLLSSMFMSGSLVGVAFLLVTFVWVRASLPRVRFDKLMFLFWVQILPFILGIMAIYLTLF